jgi:cytochrome oxidase Cu insertion factor (SCO1/SenC/PrrC family)
MLIALPERMWSSPRPGRVIVGGTGLFFLAMAVLQAWPGRGFWQGQLGHGAVPGTLTAMVRQMSATPQPAFISSLLTSFAAFDAAHGWGVNLFLVLALSAIGLALVSGRSAIARVGVIAGVVFCLADWVLVEDFGFFGGVGTDPNSMIPMCLIFVAGYLGMTRVPAIVESPTSAIGSGGGGQSFWARITSRPAHLFRSLAAVGAIGITLVGVVPMAAASVNQNADPIIAQAIDGSPSSVNTPAPPFRLVDQRGAVVSLGSLRGKAVALVFLDPVCVSDCPLIAQELLQADGLLGAASRRVALVAVVANPIYRARAYLLAFDRQEGLERLGNWHFLTGSALELTRIWNAFGIQVGFAPGGAMVAHSDISYVIDPEGRARYILNDSPGPGSQASRSSFALVLANELRSVLKSS